MSVFNCGHYACIYVALKFHFVIINMFNSTNDNLRTGNLSYLDFTTSVFRGSTCRSETGSTASASPRRASPWSLCKDQIYCAENRKGPASGDRKSDVRYKGQNSLELLDPGQHGLVFVVAQMHVVSTGMPGVEGMVAKHVQALRNSREREIEMWLLTLRFRFRLHFPASYLPRLGWNTC